MGRVLDAGRQRRVGQVIEHQLRRQAAQQVGELDDLRALHVELQVPAEIRDAFRERLDHVDLDHRGGRVAQGEADAAHACGMERFQLGIRDRRVENGDASRVRTELRDRIDRHPVVDGVVARLDDDDARRSDALLQQAVMRHGGIGRSDPRAG